MFTKFSQQAKDLKKQLYNKCCDEILKFGSLNDFIEQFNENDPVDKFYLKKIKEKISQAISENLESAKDLESFDDIGKALKSLDNAQMGQKTLERFLNDANEFSDLVNEGKWFCSWN